MSEAIKLGNHAVEQFLKGGLCVLKSGGPFMVVTATPLGDVVTIWFGGAQPMTGKFPADAVRKLTQDEIDRVTPKPKEPKEPAEPAEPNPQEVRKVGKILAPVAEKA